MSSDLKQLGDHDAEIWSAIASSWKRLGPTATRKDLLGAVMVELKGKANPSRVLQLLFELETHQAEQTAKDDPKLAALLGLIK